MPSAQFLCHISQILHSGHKYFSFMVFVLDIQGHLWLYCLFLKHKYCNLFTNKFLFVETRFIVQII